MQYDSQAIVIDGHQKKIMVFEFENDCVDISKGRIVTKNILFYPWIIKLLQSKELSALKLDARLQSTLETFVQKSP